MKVLYLVVASCWWKICTAYYTPEALADQIKTIPGSDSALLSNQFSGYLDISSSQYDSHVNSTAGKFIHYIYVESEDDPENDPVFFWTNG